MTSPAKSSTVSESGTRVAAPQESRAVETVVEQFVTAWNQHDPAKMAACWAADGDLINPMGRLARGRDQVERLLREEHQGPMKSSRHQIKVGFLRFAGDDLALVDGECEIQGIRDSDDTEMPTMRPHLFLVMTRKSGQWKVLTARPCVYKSSAEA